jgi:hypothetical protein
MAFCKSCKAAKCFGSVELGRGRHTALLLVISLAQIAAYQGVIRVKTRGNLDLADTFGQVTLSNFGQPQPKPR